MLALGDCCPEPPTCPRLAKEGRLRLREDLGRELWGLLLHSAMKTLRLAQAIRSRQDETLRSLWTPSPVLRPWQSRDLLLREQVRGNWGKGHRLPSHVSTVCRRKVHQNLSPVSFPTQPNQKYSFLRLRAGLGGILQKYCLSPRDSELKETERGRAPQALGLL